MKQLCYIIIVGFVLLCETSSYAQDNRSSNQKYDNIGKSSLSKIITEVNSSFSSVQDSVCKGVSIKYYPDRNIIMVTKRVIGGKDPFCDILGKFFKEYYRLGMIQTIVIDWTNKDSRLESAMRLVRPEIDYVIYGKETTSLFIDYSELEEAKDILNKGYVYLEDYKEWLSSLYFQSMSKDEFLDYVKKTVSEMQDEMPYPIADHIQMQEVRLVDNDISLFMVQDDLGTDDNELLYERMQKVFALKEFNRGMLKAMSKYGIKIRYVYTNKSDNSVFSDTTFAGEELLEISKALSKDLSKDIQTWQK